MSTIGVYQPGDLVATTLPDGTFRLVEFFGDGLAGFGDVSFRIPWHSWAVVASARTPTVDSFIGKPFQSIDDLRAAMVKADAGVRDVVALENHKRGFYAANRPTVEAK